MEKLTQEFLLDCLEKGMSNRDIEKITNYSKSNIQYFIKKFNLESHYKYKKNSTFNIGKIDSKEKAYLLGFICCDGAINQNNLVEVSLEKNDKETLDYLANIVNANVFVDNTFDKKTKRFPRVRMSKKINDIKTFVGGRLKTERHFPITNKDLGRYALLGAFDADGCITWGRRKDKNRIWHKISFTTSLKIASGIQMFLIKELNISTTIHPKSNSECYVIEFANKIDIYKFLDYLYQDDFIVMKRKYNKANALRLELEENGEGARCHNTVPSLQSRKV